MNVVDELKNLDVNDVGRWPLVFRAAVILICFLAVTALGIWFTIIKDKLPSHLADKYGYDAAMVSAKLEALAFDWRDFDPRVALVSGSARWQY